MRDPEKAIRDYQDGRPITDIVHEQGVGRSTLYDFLRSRAVPLRRGDDEGEGMCHLAVRVSKSTRRQAKAAAQRRGWTLSAWVEGVLQDALDGSVQRDARGGAVAGVAEKTTDERGAK